MSEENKPRKIEEIQADFQNLCAKAGHVQYQLFVFENDLKLLNEQIRDLNFEAAASQAAAKAEQPKKEEESTNG